LCAIDEEVNVDAITVPLELDDQQTICDVPSITINATSTDDVSYWWNTQDATASILVQSSGTYSVCVVDMPMVVKIRKPLMWYSTHMHHLLESV